MTELPVADFQLVTRVGDVLQQKTTYGIPLAVLAELTHRCPLQCPYCSNPVELEAASKELTTAEWCRVMDELAEIGVLQIHFSGGEPTVRKDLTTLVAHATKVGLYSNLITSAVMLTRDRLADLAEAGLSHVKEGVIDGVVLRVLRAPVAGSEDLATTDAASGQQDGHARWPRVPPPP